ncbi:MAG: NADH-quinone oxidoreductase subunit J [Actinobacteria bacterium]|nr:NADH-quinone oxidoreductase subunit J [Actinomycetota bacterium]
MLSLVHPFLAVTTLPDAIVFAVAAVIIVAGAVGVIVERNPVHSALALVTTLFGTALIFLLLGDDFIAAVQIIVYAGAIVVLFLFVIMFLGVDKKEMIAHEPLKAQRPLALLLVLLAVVGILLLGAGAHYVLGASSSTGVANHQPGGEVAALGRAVFTTYLLPFEATAALLIIAIIGAVVLTKRHRDETQESVLSSPYAGEDGTGEDGTGEDDFDEDGFDGDEAGEAGYDEGGSEEGGSGDSDAREKADAMYGVDTDDVDATESSSERESIEERDSRDAIDVDSNEELIK